MANSESWYIWHRDKEQGPFTSAQVKKLASHAKIDAETQIRRESSEEWISAGRIKGLFTTSPAAPKQAAASNAVVETTEERVPCPYCSEAIIATAIKCRHCGEFLDGRNSQAMVVEQEPVQEFYDEQQYEDYPAQAPVSDTGFPIVADDPRMGGGGGGRSSGKRGRMKPHRGSTILILGLLGIFMCGIFTGIPAVIMGSGDLSAMRRKQMDPQGRGQTLAGVIMGYFTIAVSVLAIILQIVLMSLLSG